MDSKKAGSLLERVLAIHKSLEPDRKLSAIDQDIILESLRDLYDYYRSAQVGMPLPGSKTTAAPPAAPLVPKPAGPVVQSEQSAPKVDPAPKPAPASRPTPAPRPAPAPAPPPRATPAPTPSFGSDTVPSRISGPIPAKVRSLFEDKGAQDLSEQLARSPIGDLTKALSIADRALYAQTLFGGNQELMKHFLQDCNRHSSFEEVKQSLSELAITHDWSDDQRSATARQFIKLIRRRYA